MTTSNSNMVSVKNIVKDVSFRADRALLRGTLHHAKGTPKAAIVIHGATGVPHRYYRHFAGWLATQGYTCLTYDYRDFGASATGHLRQSKATMAEWGVQDQSAAQRFVETSHPNAPLWVIGHSLGGLMVPFQEGANRIERLITVSSGLVHLRDHPWPYRAVAAGLWYGPGPFATKIMGYLPAKSLRIGHDIPAGVYWQWRRWCTSDGFYLRDVGRKLAMPDWRAFTGQLKAVAIADDDLVPPAVVWRGMQAYPEARKMQLLLQASDFGLSKIGHISAFHPNNKVVWPSLILDK